MIQIYKYGLLVISINLPTDEVNFTGTVTANSFLPFRSFIFIKRNNTLANMSIIRVPSKSIITNILPPKYGARTKFKGKFLGTKFYQI